MGEGVREPLRRPARRRPRTANWDSQRRLEETSRDGLAAEVLFPNTVPPFFPSGNLTAYPPKAGEHELRWEGLKAHNRWLSDFCNDAPGRRAGMAQILVFTTSTRR